MTLEEAIDSAANRVTSTACCDAFEELPSSPVKGLSRKLSRVSFSNSTRGLATCGAENSFQQNNTELDSPEVHPQISFKSSESSADVYSEIDKEVLLCDSVECEIEQSLEFANTGSKCSRDLHTSCAQSWREGKTTRAGARRKPAYSRRFHTSRRSVYQTRKGLPLGLSMRKRQYSKEQPSTSKGSFRFAGKMEYSLWPAIQHELSATRILLEVNHLLML